MPNTHLVVGLLLLLYGGLLLLLLGHPLHSLLSLGRLQSGTPQVQQDKGITNSTIKPRENKPLQCTVNMWSAKQWTRLPRG